MTYLFETHAHTAEISPCSNVAAKDLIAEYKDHGYAGVIITDHVGDWGFSGIRGTWKDKISALMAAFQKAKDAGDKAGVKVLFGMEIALNHPYQDYLVYGPGPDFLYDNPDIQELSLKELSTKVREYGGVIFAAHPFRGAGIKEDPVYLNGAEVFNGNPRNNSHNSKAERWAKENNLFELAGSDFHEHGDISAGVELSRMPADIKEFVEIIKDGSYKLKI